MSERSVECFFDCSSPWTYLAFQRLRRLAGAEGFTVRWRPFLVGAVFNAVNPSVYRSRDEPVPAKEAYMRKDLADWAWHAGLTLRWPPSVFPVNSAAAMRGCLHAAANGRLEPFAARVFAAYWSDDRDIADRRVLAELAAAAGLERAPFLAAIESEALRERLRANTEELVARGGFGTPTLFVGGEDMYFGNDRLELVLAALQRSGAGAREPRA